jgi:hypothetical protein
MLSDVECVACRDAAGSHASRYGRVNARRHFVPLEGRCAYAFNGKAKFLKS